MVRASLASTSSAVVIVASSRCILGVPMSCLRTFCPSMAEQAAAGSGTVRPGDAAAADEGGAAAPWAVAPARPAVLRAVASAAAATAARRGWWGDLRTGDSKESRAWASLRCGDGERRCPPTEWRDVLGVAHLLKCYESIV